MATPKKAPTPGIGSAVKVPTIKIPLSGGNLNKPTIGGTPQTPGTTKPPVDSTPPDDPRIADLQRQLQEAQNLLAKQQAAANDRNRNIAAQLIDMFNGYDLGSLAPEILRMIQDGMGPDEITLELQKTDAYKQRFAANDVRRKKGLPVLSPAEYISTERAYRQVMQAAGLPVGFYDSKDDFRKFLENDVSATEVQQRVQVAAEAVNSAPPGTLDTFRQFYGDGDLIAFALDPSKAEPLVEQRIKAAEAGAYGRQQGVGLSQGMAENLGRQGLSLGQMQQGMGAVGQDLPTVSKLGQLYGSAVSADDLVKATFNNDAESTNKVNKLKSQERGVFGGTGAASGSSLSKNAGSRL